MSTKLEQLQQEAKELGLEFHPKLGEAKLQKMVDEYYASQESNEKEVTAKVEKKEVEEKTTESKPSNGAKTMGQLAREMEEAARKTKIITIVDNDQRVNNQTTSCTVNCGNEWFELGQMVLPLNIEVEVMQGHIDVLKEVEIPMHIKDHKTGMHSVELRKRYSISFSDKTPEAE